MGNTLHSLPPIPPAPNETPEQQQLGNSNCPSCECDDEYTQSTCEICIEPMPTPASRFRNGAADCAHPFCTDCVIKYIRARLEEYSTGQIKCPASNCDRTLDPLACASLVGDALFVRWCDALCEGTIAGFDRCYCPYRNCNVLIVNECGGTVGKSSCPSCKRCFCFQCKSVWHAGFGCEESGERRDRNDVAFGMLAEQKRWMRCPKCRHFVELMEGCHIVRCRCGIKFCYKCGKQVHQYLCRCDTTYRRCELYYRICIVIFLAIVVVFTTLEFGRYKHTLHDDYNAVG